MVSGQHYKEVYVMRDSELKVVDLFCGCGGMSMGFEKAGFNVVASYDNWDPAIAVYRLNFQHPIYKRDLLDTKYVSDIASHKPDVIIGGPPCQDFSSAGHRDETLGRANLTLSYADIITKILPRFFVMENVPTIKKSEKLEIIKRQFKEAGYGLSELVLDASLCGVPQKRKRFFLIGHLGGVDEALLPFLKKHLATKSLTLHDYFGDTLGFEYYFRVPRSYSRRGIFSIYEPAMTVRGVDRPVPKGYPGHPGDPIPMNDSIRTLTIEERSQFQTFPKDFRYEGSKTVVNQMIGNAVPVNLAKYVATALKEYIYASIS